MTAQNTPPAITSHNQIFATPTFPQAPDERVLLASALVVVETHHGLSVAVGKGAVVRTEPLGTPAVTRTGTKSTKELHSSCGCVKEVVVENSFASD